MRHSACISVSTMQYTPLCKHSILRASGTPQHIILRMLGFRRLRRLQGGVPVAFELLDDVESRVDGHCKADPIRPQGLHAVDTHQLPIQVQQRPS